MSPCSRLTKAPPPWKRGRQKRGDRNRGRGSLREDVKAVAFLHHVVFFCACCGAHLCFYVLILRVCVCPWDKTECAVLEHSLLNISTVCLLYNEIRSFVRFFFSVHSSLQQKQQNYELKEEPGDGEPSAHDGDSTVSKGSL